jgi:hypothetical protein
MTPEEIEALKTILARVKEIKTEFDKIKTEIDNLPCRKCKKKECTFEDVV